MRFKGTENERRCKGKGKGNFNAKGVWERVWTADWIGVLITLPLSKMLVYAKLLLGICSRRAVEPGLCWHVLEFESVLDMYRACAGHVLMFCTEGSILVLCRIL